MSQPFTLLVILVLLIPLWVKLAREYVGGLSYGIVILIACTHVLMIKTPGGLPELTIDRLVVLSLLVFWIRKRDPDQRLRDVPLARHIGVWALVALVSLLGGINYFTGIKRYLDYVLNVLPLYFVLVTSLRTRDDVMRILRAACVGVTIVAVLAIVERYSRINVVDAFIGYNLGVGEEGPPGDIRATYHHRILLGAGMAMGWPLLFYFAQAASSKALRCLAWCSILAMLAACYFSMSRGPWLAAIGAGGVLLAFGTLVVRKRVGLICGLALLVLVARPGIYESLFSRAQATLDADSFKGATFQYRLELWRVAITEVAKSPWRILFGYGPGSGAEQSLDWTLSYKGKDSQIWSWDNEFAYALYQYGFVGMIATIALYATIGWRLLGHARRESGRERELHVCLAASALVLFFMMTNVMIFARQLYYLLWIVTAAAFILASRKPDPDCTIYDGQPR